MRPGHIARDPEGEITGGLEKQEPRSLACAAGNDALATAGAGAVFLPCRTPSSAASAWGGEVREVKMGLVLSNRDSANNVHLIRTAV
jgi:hypothetical protein